MVVAVIVGSVGVALSGFASGRGDAMPFVLDFDFITKHVEPKVKLPKGARALASYRRYYAVEYASTGAVYVVGTLIHEAAAPGIQIVELDDLPKRFDGGCDAIDVRYSVSARRVLSVRCNGVA